MFRGWVEWRVPLQSWVQPPPLAAYSPITQRRRGLPGYRGVAISGCQSLTSPPETLHRTELYAPTARLAHLFPGWRADRRRIARLNVLQNHMLGPRVASRKGPGLPRHASGGQKQRLAIPRALCMEPDVMLSTNGNERVATAAAQLALQPKCSHRIILGTDGPASSASRHPAADSSSPAWPTSLLKWSSALRPATPLESGSSTAA